MKNRCYVDVKLSSVLILLSMSPTSKNIHKFCFGIFNRQSHTNQVSTTGLGHSDIQLLTRPGNDQTESDRVLKYKITCPKTRLSLSSSSREPSQSSAWPLWRTDRHRVRARDGPAERRMGNYINICITPSIQPFFLWAIHIMLINLFLWNSPPTSGRMLSLTRSFSKRTNHCTNNLQFY